jgi:hypothetical protein
MQRLECGPVEALGQCPGVVALLPVRSRRLARFGGSRRGATDMDWGGARISLGSYPPHPPTMETPPGGGQAEQREGGAIDFANAGVWGVREKPGDCTPQQPANRCSTKRWCLTGCPKYSPGCAIYSSGLVFFSTGLIFWFCAVASLSFSFLPMKREREREGLAGKRLIHGFLRCLKKHPRVCMPIHGFSGDEKRGRNQCWRGFAGYFTQFHASTGRNAHTSLEKVRNEH